MGRPGGELPVWFSGAKALGLSLLGEFFDLPFSLFTCKFNFLSLLIKLLGTEFASDPNPIV
ncbi:hypothetical protein X474_08950 [Dethiosulfatarculus sandiegensis]|uniref:Uncharacterized protein n=1 Tax=Dethiosulfatarculus sandiegensis TaxID=1429043 RepID=A0A0D2HVB3_9BACT|nr:hypothetical protein X474_08950 [Dethiosulfatarculus sandiegensis]